MDHLHIRVRETESGMTAVASNSQIIFSATGLNKASAVRNLESQVRSSLGEIFDVVLKEGGETLLLNPKP